MEILSNNVDRYLPKLNKSQLISVLTQLGINTESKPDVIRNNQKVIWWIQKGYEDIMEDEERDLEAKVKHLQDLLNFIIAFTDNNGKHQKDVEQHEEGKHVKNKKRQWHHHSVQKQQVQNNTNLP